MTTPGAPPGYVGYDEGGILTEAVRRRPYQVRLTLTLPRPDSSYWGATPDRLSLYVCVCKCRWCCWTSLRRRTGRWLTCCYRCNVYLDLHTYSPMPIVDG